MVKEWLTVWFYISMAAIGLLILAVLMPFIAVHRLVTHLQEKRLYDDKWEKK
tara:strand:- start:447 stop:602 length:156 start_codon:yes stop_codon:yes gene_type:complete